LATQGRWKLCFAGWWLARDCETQFRKTVFPCRKACFIRTGLTGFSGFTGFQRFANPVHPENPVNPVHDS
jgi:hypothetical protein